MASSRYDILFCSATLVSGMYHVAELLVPGFGRPVLCRGRIPRAWGMAVCVRDGYGAFHQPKFECGCCEMMFLMGLWSETELICVQSLPQPWPRWPDFWLFTNMNGCSAGWGCACLFPVCWWIEWPSSGVVEFYNHKSSWCCSLWHQLCLVAISFLPARPMHMEHLTCWWLMFLT